MKNTALDCGALNAKLIVFELVLKCVFAIALVNHCILRRSLYYLLFNLNYHVLQWCFKKSLKHSAMDENVLEEL